MTDIVRCPSPVGELLLAAKDEALVGLWLESDRFYAEHLGAETAARETPVLTQTLRWLDVYFSGREPDFTPPLRPQGSAFRQAVWKLLLEIPYGQTTTYGALARQLAAQTGRAKMSAQAVGGAVGHNPISIIIPCHRVVGTNGSLTGYGGGIAKKVALLQLEHTDMSALFVPEKGTAL